MSEHYSEHHKVTLDGDVYELAEGANLLQALLSSGRLIRHSCLAGACESCALYHVADGQKVLSCQHEIDGELVLTSHMPIHYNVPCQVCSIEEISLQWCIVKVMVPMHLELGVAVEWQLGERTGHAFCCSVEDGMTGFVMPKALLMEREQDLASLKLANTLSRSKLDLSADSVVLASTEMAVIAQQFIAALQTQGVAVASSTIPLDLTTPLVGYELKRFDQAFILSDLPIALTEFEQWLMQSKVRLSQPIYLTMSFE